MGDSVEFAIDVSTTVETIVKMKAKIKEYVNSNFLCFSFVYWNLIS
jgi:hypothetical protein